MSGLGRACARRSMFFFCWWLRCANVHMCSLKEGWKGGGGHIGASLVTAGESYGLIIPLVQTYYTHVKTQRLPAGTSGASTEQTVDCVK